MNRIRTEFFKRFSDGIPIYNENKYIINRYSLVFFDGPHSVSAIKTECDFFIERIVEGGVFIFDDINQYEHMEKIHPYILENNFSVLEKGKRMVKVIARENGRSRLELPPLPNLGFGKKSKKKIIK